MKKKTILAVVVLFALTLSITTATGQMVDILGHDFTEDKWGIEVDLNGQSFWNNLGSTTSDWKVVKDVSGLPNDQVTEDTDDFDQQFYMAFTNQSGIETAYLALEQVSGEVKVDVPVLGEVNLGLVNATAPFQTLIQHWESFDEEIFMANTFNAFVAYTTTPDDQTLDGEDDVYLGYTLVADRLLDAINDLRGDPTYDPNEVLPEIPDFNAVPVWNEIDENTLEVGMTYHNVMTFWQESKPELTASYGGFDYNIDTHGVLYDFHAATLFDEMSFTYKISTETDENGTVYGNVKFEYELSPVSLMFTTDDPTSYANLVSAGVCDDTNSFNVPNFQVQFTAGGATFLADLGSFSAFVEEAARNRIKARGTEDWQQGFGIAGAYTTNSYEVGYTLTVPSPMAGTGSEITYPIQLGGNTVFETDFTSAPYYDLTYENGTVAQLPLYIEFLNPADVFNGAVVQPYFDLQWAMMGTFLGWTGYYLSPMLAAAVTNPYSTPSQIGMDVDSAHAVWFLQCREWNGLQIEMDPTFSAVAAVKSDEESSSSSQPGGEDTSRIGIPGFEMLTLLAAIPAIIYLKRKK